MAADGYLFQRGATYYGRIRLAGREYGPRSLRTSDLKEAKKRLKAWRLAIERAAFGVADCPTLEAVTVRWAQEILPQAVKPAVRQRYLSSMRQIVDPRNLGNLKVDAITVKTVAEYVSLRSRATTNATIRRDLTALSRLMACCVSWGHRDDNPVKAYDLSLIRERRDPIQPPDPRDIARVIAAAPMAVARILTLLDQTGMREEEAVQLEGQQLNWTREQILLTKTKTSRPRVLDMVTPGGDARAALAGSPEIGPIFTSSKTGRAYQNFASQAASIVKRIADEDPSFRRFRIHDLRHGFAIRALKAGMNLRKLSRHLGHKNTRTTENVYLAYLSEEEAAQAEL